MRYIFPARQIVLTERHLPMVVANGFGVHSVCVVLVAAATFVQCVDVTYNRNALRTIIKCGHDVLI